MAEVKVTPQDQLRAVREEIAKLEKGIGKVDPDLRPIIESSLEAKRTEADRLTRKIEREGESTLRENKIALAKRIATREGLDQTQYTIKIVTEADYRKRLDNARKRQSEREEIEIAIENAARKAGIELPIGKIVKLANQPKGAIVDRSERLTHDYQQELDKIADGIGIDLRHSVIVQHWNPNAGKGRRGRATYTVTAFDAKGLRKLLGSNDRTIKRGPIVADKIGVPKLGEPYSAIDLVNTILKVGDRGFIAAYEATGRGVSAPERIDMLVEAGYMQVNRHEEHGDDPKARAPKAPTPKAEAKA